MSAQAGLFPAGRVWIVRLGAGGPAYWFTSPKAAGWFAGACGKPASNFVFPAEPGEAA